MQLSTFNYESNEIRVVLDEQTQEPSWVAKDICDVLGYHEVSKTVSKLDDDEKGTKIIRTLGGDQAMMCVNESGLYTLILRSNKPQAKAFKRWVTHDVIPSIRKTGSYQLDNVQPIQIQTAPNKSITIFRNQSGGLVAGDGSVRDLLKADMMRGLEKMFGTKNTKHLYRQLIPALNTPEALQDEIQDQNDTLRGFIDCYIVREEGSRCKCIDLYETYLKWCDKTEDKPLKMVAFTARLKTYGLGKHKNMRIGDWRGNGFDGFFIAPMGGAL